MPIDLAPEVLAALDSDRVIARFVERLAPAVADQVLARIEAREHDRLVDLAGLAELLGCSPTAAKARVHRDGELAGLALRVGSRRRWRRSAVLALLEARAAERAGGRRLRAGDGGGR